MSNREEIDRFVRWCQSQESLILLGQTQLTLSSKLLLTIYGSKLFNSQLNYIKNICKRAPCIKIIGDVDLTHSEDALQLGSCSLSACTSLELHRIPFAKINGIDETLRTQLRSLSCVKSIPTRHLDEQFWDLFGSWPALKHLKITHNHLETVNAGILPSSLQSLNLSWNRIQVFNNVTDYSVNGITKLDLSYNALTCLPQLSTINYQTLSCLYIRSNLIESVTGIHQMVSLSELDIAFNCVLDVKSLLKSLSTCDTLRMLWIEGNPCCYDKNVNQSIKSQLNQLTHLDGVVLVRDLNDREREKGKEDNNRMKPELKREKSVSSNLSSNDTDVDSQMERAEDRITSSAVSNIVGSSLESGDGMMNQAKNGQANRKKKTHRIAMICDKEEVDNNSDSKVTDERTTNVKIRVIKEEEEGRSRADSKQMSKSEDIKQKRKEYGDSWLVSLQSTPSKEYSFLSSSYTYAKTPIDQSSLNENFLASNISPPIAESTPIAKSEYIDEDTIQARSKSIQTKLSTTANPFVDDIEVVKEEVYWTKEELDQDENIYLVECPDTNETLFVYVREDDGMVFEKDCLSGKVLRSFDLKILSSVEIMTTEALLKLTFDSKVKSKSERIYKFESLETCHKFKESFVVPWMKQRKMSMGSNHEYDQIEFECLKCGLHKICGDSMLMQVCPHCGSDAIMKIDERRRRSGSDITVLSKVTQDIHAMHIEETLRELEKLQKVEEINMWQELMNQNEIYDSSYFTKVDRRLKLYFELEVFNSEESVEGSVSCKIYMESLCQFEDALLVLSTKNIYICAITDFNSSESEDIRSKIRIILKKDLTKLKNVINLPSHLINQGFLIEWNRDSHGLGVDGKEKVNLFFKKSLKKAIKGEDEANKVNETCLILIGDCLIGQSFATFLKETLIRSKCVAQAKFFFNPHNILIDDNNYMIVEDEILDVQLVSSAKYKTDDMRSAITISHPSVILTTKQLIHLAQLTLDANFDSHLKIIYKQAIINLSSPVLIDLHSHKLILHLTDDYNEAQVQLSFLSNNSIKKVLTPIKKQWEDSFEVPLIFTNHIFDI